MPTIAELSVAITANTKDAEAGLSKIDKQAKDAGDSLDKSGQKGESGLGHIKSAAEDASGGIGHFLEGIGMFAAADAITSAASAGFDLLKSNVVDFVSAGISANQIDAQLAAGLKSTHDASGQTTDSLNKLADSLTSQTGITNDSVKSAESMLLTFTNIGGSVFPQATQAVADLATKMANGAVPSSQQMEQASIQLGKALGNPLTGFSALQRVGVTFSEQQKEQIKNFMKVGDVAGAQGVILGEMNKEFGGSAAAAGQANGGLAIFSAQLDSMKEQVGQAVIPILVQLGQAALPLVNAAMGALPGILSTVSNFLSANVMPAVGALSAWIKGDGLPDLQNLGSEVMQHLVPTLQQMEQWFVAKVLPAVTQFAGFVATNVIPVVGQLAGFILTNVVPIIQQLATIFLTDVLPALERIWTAIATSLIPALESLWNKISPVLIPALQGLGTIISTVVGPALSGIVTAAGTVIKKLSDLIGFVTSNQPVLIGLGVVIAGIATAIGANLVGSLVAAIPQIMASVAAFGAQAVAAGAAALATLAAAAPFIAVGAAIALLIVGIVELVQHWSQVSNWLGSVWHAVVGQVQVELTGLGTIISNVASGIGDAFKGGIDTVIGDINGFISFLDSIQIHIPAIGVGPVSTPAFDWNGLGIPQIPYLASGGDVFPGGQAVVGEAGPELLSVYGSGARVRPLSGGAGASIGAGVQQTIVIQLDGQVLARATAKNLPEAIRLTSGTRNF